MIRSFLLLFDFCSFHSTLIYFNAVILLEIPVFFARANPILIWYSTLKRSLSISGTKNNTNKTRLYYHYQKKKLNIVIVCFHCWPICVCGFVKLYTSNLFFKKSIFSLGPSKNAPYICCVFQLLVIKSSCFLKWKNG